MQLPRFTGALRTAVLIVIASYGSITRAQHSVTDLTRTGAIVAEQYPLSVIEHRLAATSLSSEPYQVYRILAGEWRKQERLGRQVDPPDGLSAVQMRFDISDLNALPSDLVIRLEFPVPELENPMPYYVLAFAPELDEDRLVEELTNREPLHRWRGELQGT